MRDRSLCPLEYSLSTFRGDHASSIIHDHEAIRERSRMPFPSLSSVTLHTRKPRFLGAPRLLRGFSASGAESLINLVHDVLSVTPGPAVLGVTFCDHSVCPVCIVRSNCGIRHAEGGVAGNSGRHVFISLFHRGRSIDHRSIISIPLALSTTPSLPWGHCYTVVILEAVLVPPYYSVRSPPSPHPSRRMGAEPREAGEYTRWK